jgi:alginate O-acetyltransferase complex protein AlgI
MVFSSPVFLFVFAPLFFTTYYLSPRRFRNLAITIGSLAFYFVGTGYLAAVFLFSIFSNFFIGRKLTAEHAKRGNILFLGIVCNLVPLLYFKYKDFFLQASSDLLNIFGLGQNTTLTGIVLPLGISFYTFHGISYLVDIYRKKVAPSASLLDFAMYMANFPQLIAGPIVRYIEIAHSIRDRPVRKEQIFSGIVRFTFGLGKKLVLADSLGAIADPIFALPGNTLSGPVAWLGTAAYTLQIYYDFSGYSDMAIGLGRMMGFEFPENFDQPYRSQSVTEFWRRWHMTLSRWFRDYVYIPLGGNRGGPVRTYANLVIVFFLCGLWHGAAYAFVFWGLYHGALLTIERLLRGNRGFEPKGTAGQVLTIVMVMIGWVFFRAPSFAEAGSHLAAMFWLNRNVDTTFGAAFYLTDDKIFVFLAGMIFALFPFERLNRWTIAPAFATCAQIAAMLAVLVYSSAVVATNGFNPFIYFRF